MMSETITSGLYNPAREHDACGFGFVARVDGRRTREIVEEGFGTKEPGVLVAGDADVPL